MPGGYYLGVHSHYTSSHYSDDRHAEIAHRAGGIDSPEQARPGPVFTVADIRLAVPTASDSHIRKVLHSLRDAGVIDSTGRGRAAAWRGLT